MWSPKAALIMSSYSAWVFMRQVPMFIRSIVLRSPEGRVGGFLSKRGAKGVPEGGPDFSVGPPSGIAALRDSDISVGRVLEGSHPPFGILDLAFGFGRKCTRADGG